MRTIPSWVMIIIMGLVFSIGQPTNAFAQALTKDQQELSQYKTLPPADGEKLSKVIDSISGNSILIPQAFYETQIVAHWGNQLCIAPSQNTEDKRCTTLQVQQIVENGGTIFVVLNYGMALNDQANTYSNRGLPHGMWFGQPCVGGWIKGFVYHAGLPGNQFEKIDQLPPTFPVLDVC